MVVGLVSVAVLATLTAPERCSDYPDGRRCDALGYSLIVAACLATVLVLILLGRVAIVSVRGRRAHDG